MYERMEKEIVDLGSAIERQEMEAYERELNAQVGQIITHRLSMLPKPMAEADEPARNTRRHSGATSGIKTILLRLKMPSVGVDSEGGCST